MCEYCSDPNGKPITMAESTKIGNSIWLYYFAGNDKAEIDKRDIEEVDNSIVFEMRNGNGYIRLVDRDDMNCLDHGVYTKVPYCPMCGRELKAQAEKLKP